MSQPSDSEARLRTAAERQRHLKDYLKILRKHIWLTIGVFVVVSLATVVWTFSQTPVFMAAATVLIEPEPPRVINIPEVTPMTAAGPDYYQTQYEIIKSRAVAQKALETLIKVSTPQVDSVDAILRSVSAEPKRGTRLVLVKAEHTDPKVAAAIANAVASAYVKHNLDIKLRGSQDALSWLNEQMTSLRQKVQESSIALQNYRVKAGILGMNEQRQITTSKIMDFNKAYLEAQAQRLNLEAKLREVQRIARDKAGSQTIFTVADNALIQKLRSGAADLDIQRSKFLRTYKEKHPEILKIDAQIQQINQRIDAEVKTMLKAVETEYQVAKAREETLLQNVNQIKREAQELNEKEIQYVALQRESEAVQQLHDAVLKRLKETGVAGGLETNNARVLEDARPPLVPIKPKKERNVTIGTVLGLALGIGLAIMLEYFDTTLRSPDEVERLLGLPVIGVVPQFAGKR